MITSSSKQQTPLQQLKKLDFANKKQKYTSVPAEYIPQTKFSDRTDRGLLHCIAAFLRLNNYQATISGNTISCIISGQKQQFTANVKQSGGGFSSFATFHNYFSKLVK